MVFSIRTIERTSASRTIRGTLEFVNPHYREIRTIRGRTIRGPGV